MTALERLFLTVICVLPMQPTHAAVIGSGYIADNFYFDYHTHTRPDTHYPNVLSLSVGNQLDYEVLSVVLDAPVVNQAFSLSESPAFESVKSLFTNGGEDLLYLRLDAPGAYASLQNFDSSFVAQLNNASAVDWQGYEIDDITVVVSDFQFLDFLQPRNLNGDLSWYRRYDFTVSMIVEGTAIVPVPGAVVFYLCALTGLLCFRHRLKYSALKRD